MVDRGSRILPAYYNPSEILLIEPLNNSVRYEMKASKRIDQVIEYRIADWLYKAFEVSGCKIRDVQTTESIKTHGRTIFEAKWS